LVKKTIYGLYNYVQFLAGVGIFLHHHDNISSMPHSASYPMGAGVSFLEVKRLKSKADPSPPSIADIKNM
jgi:hypothetical protein